MYVNYHFDSSLSRLLLFTFPNIKSIAPFLYTLSFFPLYIMKNTRMTVSRDRLAEFKRVRIMIT